MAARQPRLRPKTRPSQHTFAAGVLSPQAAARSDMDQYGAGVTYAKNFFVSETGGLIRRPGWRWLGYAKHHDKQGRLLPFEFSTEQTYALEVGDVYLRIWKDGGLVIDPAGSGTDIVEAATYKWTQSPSEATEYHLELLAGGDPGIAEPDGVYEDADGAGTLMARLEPGYLTTGTWGWGDNDTLGYDTVYVTLTVGGDPDAQADGYIEAGYAIEVVMPYVEADVSELDHVQSADVMTIAHEEYPPAEVSRTDHHIWSHDEIVVGTQELKPKKTDTFYTPGVGYRYRYAVSVEGLNGEESEAVFTPWLDSATEVGILGQFITLFVETLGWNSPLDPTTEWPREDVAAYHIYRQSDLDEVRWPPLQWGWLTRIPVIDFWDAASWTDAVTVFSLNPFRLTVPTHSLFNIVGSLYGCCDMRGWEGTGTSTTPAGKTVDWLNTTELFDAQPPSTTTIDPQVKLSGVDIDGTGWTITNVGDVRIWLPIIYTDTGEVDPDFSSTPIFENNPFSKAGDYPSRVTYYADRSVYAATLNNPQGLWMSRPGAYKVFSRHATVQDDDPITKSLPARRANKVRSLTPLDSLLAGTSSSIFRVWAADGVVTPRALNARAWTERGCSTLKPVIASNYAIFATDKNDRLLAVTYELSRDAYMEEDVAVRAGHLFENRTVVDWCFTQDPHSLVLLAMSDGSMLCFTFRPDQKMWAWTEWETDGYVESLISIPEGAVDAVYGLILRTESGHPEDVETGWVRRSIERLELEQPANATEAVHLDYALVYQAPTVAGVVASTPIDILTMTKASHGLQTGDRIMLKGWVAAPGTELDENPSGKTVDWLNGLMVEVGVLTAHTFVPQYLPGLLEPGAGAIITTGWTFSDEDGQYEVAVDTILGADHLMLRSRNVELLTNGVVDADGTEGWRVRRFRGDDGEVVITPPPLRLGEVFPLATSPLSFTRAVVGLRYTAEMETLDLRGAADPTTGHSSGARGQRKHINNVLVVLRDTSGLQIGVRGGTLVDVEAIEEGESGHEVSVPGAMVGLDLVKGDAHAQPLGGWSNHGRVFVQQDNPVPASLLAIVPEVTYGD